MKNILLDMKKQRITIYGLIAMDFSIFLATKIFVKQLLLAQHDLSFIRIIIVGTIFICIFVNIFLYFHVKKLTSGLS